MTTRTAISTRWHSRFSFILAATAAAVGLGNIWKFPYIMGENGGGAFVLVYLVCIFAIGVPVLIGELLIGRRGRNSPGFAAQNLAKESGAHKSWQVTGWMTMGTGFVILTFYSVIAAWAFSYIFKSASGQFAGAGTIEIEEIYTNMTGSVSELLLFTSLLIAATVFVVGKGFKHGLERAVRLLMPAMLILLAIIAIYAAQIGDFGAAVNFMFRPDFSELTINGVLIALGHAFFTLSLASGVMIMYGAYLPKETSIVSTSMWVAVADTFVALLAGLAIFPIVFGYALTPGEGPGLIFQTLPLAFATMPAGILVATVFFVMLVLAAFTSAISMIESSVAFLVEKFALNRWQAALTSGLVLWTLSLLTIYSFAGAEWTVLNWHFFGTEMVNIFNVIDHITSNVMLPLGGLAVALFTGWAIKGQFTRDELGGHPAIYNLWRFCVRYLAPLAIIIIFMQLIGVIRF
ncbi:sodium-dependent transporter [Aliidiomarina minuta]|uniref:Transporter n=1 Tax=Aliidiomarina minuta TaxID=880057 RepID=A0A432W6X3_9GAMM|nr:sodium-dependent transporter [Aliidiomarina minuta]RUO25716.1 sodium-dependent transporter [Aliidiomarina minuta]